MNEVFSIDIGPVLTSLWESVTFETFLKFGIVYFFIIWIAILVWVIRDIGNRTSSITLQVISILTILFLTPFGVFIYLLIRPGKTLFEKYYEEIEENLDTFSSMVEDKAKSLEEKNHCFSCDEPICPDFKFCPHCKVGLKIDCTSCKKSIFEGWEICPYCGEKQKKKKKSDGEKVKKEKKEVKKNKSTD